MLLIPRWALFKLIGVSLFMSGLKTIVRSLETSHFWNASLTNDLKIKRIVVLVDQFSKLRRILSEGRCINYLTCFDFKSVVRVLRKSILKWLSYKKLANFQVKRTILLLLKCPSFQL